MTPCKWMLGAGAACAACCAAPLAASLATGSALFACTDEPLPLAAFALVAGAIAWRRRRATAGFPCEGGCDVRRA